MSSHIESISSKTSVSFYDKSTLYNKLEDLITEIDDDMKDELYLVSIYMYDGRVYEHLRDIKWKLENILSSE